MNTFDKCIVLTEAELDSLRIGLPWQSMALEPTGGKTLTDIYGPKAVEKGKTDPVNGATYSLRQQITNPNHADFGKVFIRVNSTDVNTHLPSHSARMVDYDPTWRLSE